jgi:hypothetical protein
MMPSHTARSLFGIAIWDALYGSGYLQHRTPAKWVIGSSLVGNARNKLVEMFLDNQDKPEMPNPWEPDITVEMFLDDEDKPEWLLFLDDDQVYPEHLIEAMMVGVQSVEAETGMKCLTMSVPVWRFMGDSSPTVTHNVFDMVDGSFVPWVEPLPENTVLQVAGIGAGCIMVHREALERVRDISTEHGFGHLNSWFRHIVWPRNEGEDLYFSRMLMGSGIPLFMTTSLGCLEHVKQIRLDREMTSGEVTI